MNGGLWSMRLVQKSPEASVVAVAVVVAAVFALVAVVAIKVEAAVVDTEEGVAKVGHGVAVVVAVAAEAVGKSPDLILLQAPDI